MRVLRAPRSTVIGRAILLAIVAPLYAGAALCPDARWVVATGGAALGARDGTPLVLAVSGGRATVEGGCVPSRVRLKATGRGGKLAASWSLCDGVRRVRLKARFAPACDALTGTVRAGRARVPFSARPSTCGDAAVDRGRGEQCDGTSCPAAVPCADCSCGEASCTVEAVPNEGWAHVAEGSAIDYRHDPPASGPHYPAWGRYREHPSALARGYWVHNVEHGAVVLLYRPDAPSEVVDLLRAAYQALPPDPRCGHTRALLTPDPLLAPPFAVVAADFVLTCTGVNAAAIGGFATAQRGRAPEDVCTDGSRP
jgi:hypothetical protein